MSGHILNKVPLDIHTKHITIRIIPEAPTTRLGMIEKAIVELKRLAKELRGQDNHILPKS